MEENNPNILCLDDLQRMTGETTKTKIINALERDGIQVMNRYGKHPYTTVQLVNAAAGLDIQNQQTMEIL